MKNRRLSAILLLLLSMIGCNKTEQNFPTEGTLTVLSYNVAGLPEPLSSSHPLANTPQISPRLNNYDLVNVQEDFFYHDLLIKDNHHPYKSTYLAPEGSLGDGLNMFSKFVFLNFMRTSWADCHGTDCLTPKGFTYCRVKISPDAYFDLYNVHCNAGSDSLDLVARRKNILQLCKYIDYRSKDHAVIIMGDMNCRYTRTGDNIREILDRGFTDVWVELTRDGVLPNQDGNSLMDCSPLATNPDCEVVDKIFYRSNSTLKFTATEYEIQGDKFLDSNGEWLSDHRPVYAKFGYQVIK
ncbi:MAG: endonuclease/exonuclease/phosphatase family protein [Sphingobacteriales bacterium]|jgi:endonuclease/exonuclease/phosphatase family metal-dependent hydrolase|nr:endonuclease/exonuclease/phosphatase family protein [Sphingobacteriales bacterium]